ncbi:MAG: sigma-70 family RNA polymerase sigma factor [Bacteroidota bacterium]
MERTDKDLVADIRSGGTARQKAIKVIYDWQDSRGKVIAFVKRNSGNEADGQDIYQEGIIALDRNIREGKFRGDSALSLYLFATCRFLWMNQLRKNQRVDLQEDALNMDTPSTETPEHTYVNKERSALLRQLLGQLGEKCQKVLEMWQLSYSMTEIAKAMNLSSEKMARKSKYRCQQSLMKIIKSKPDWQELLSAY